MREDGDSWYVRRSFDRVLYLSHAPENPFSSLLLVERRASGLKHESEPGIKKSPLTSSLEHVDTSFNGTHALFDFLEAHTNSLHYSLFGHGKHVHCHLL